MGIRQIVTEGDEILSKVCRPVEKFDERLAQLLDDMYETMNHADGIGIAAPQVGILRRALVIDLGEGDGKIELINPEFLEQKGEQTFQEGCLSCPGQWGETKRPAYVKIRAQDRQGGFFEMEAEGPLAVACCHEIDHLNGILFKERLIGELEIEGKK